MRTLDMKVFAERLCTSRHRKQLTKVKLAERAGLKASHLLTYLEKAQQPGVHAATLMQLAQALDVSLDSASRMTLPRTGRDRRGSPNADHALASLPRLA